MQAFLRFYLDNAETVAPGVGFIPLTDEQLDASKARLDSQIAGLHLSVGPPPAPRPRG